MIVVVVVVVIVVVVVDGLVYNLLFLSLRYTCRGDCPGGTVTCVTASPPYLLSHSICSKYSSNNGDQAYGCSSSSSCIFSICSSSSRSNINNRS